jgi:DNA-directed RNA polymerase specialized sigma subunit
MDSIQNPNKPNDFYSLFEGFTKEQIDMALKQITEGQRTFIMYYYGLGVDRLNGRELGEMFSLAASNVYIKINRGINGVKKVLSSLNEPNKYRIRNDEFYKNFSGYSRAQVDSVLETLDERKKGVICSYFGLGSEILTMKEIGAVYSVSSQRIKQIISQSIKLIKDKLENPKLLMEKSFSNDRYLNLLTLYGEIKVKGAIECLSDELCKKILKAYFGIGEESLTIKEISQVNDVSESVVCKVIKKGLDEVEAHVKNSEKVDSRLIKESEMQFFSHFKGYSKEETMGAFVKLSTKDQEILNLYHGLNTMRRTCSEISDLMGLPLSTVEEVVDNGVIKIKQLLLKEKLVSRSSGVRALFETYGEELVQRAINDLEDKEKEFLSLYYASGYSLEKISQKTAYSEKQLEEIEKVIMSKIESNIKVSFDGELMSSRRSVMKKKIKNISTMKQAIDNLPEKEREIIEMYFGLNGNGVLELDEICEKMCCNKNDLRRKIREIIDKINKYGKKK